MSRVQTEIRMEYEKQFKKVNEETTKFTDKVSQENIQLKSQCTLKY